MVDIERFARHISLPEVGLEGQQRLHQSRILIIGAGGLGSPVAMYLAAAGVGTLGIVDDDVVELSNLQRQVIHDESSKGEPKVDSAERRLRAMYPSINVETFSHRFHPDNLSTFDIDSWDLVIDGTDNIPTRYFIDDICRLYNKTWIYGSIFQFEGQVSVFNHQQGPIYRDLFPHPPPLEAVPSCSEAGVFGALPGVLGSMQATEAIKLLLGIGEPLSGVLLVYNGLDATVRRLSFEQSPERPEVDSIEQARMFFEQACRLGRESSNIGLVQEAAGGSMFENISVAEVIAKREQGLTFMLIDTRTPAEYAQDRIKGNDGNFPFDAIAEYLDSIPKDMDIVLHCKSGMRSQMAIMQLLQEGYDGKRLFNLDGGIMAWALERPDEIEQ